MATISSMTGFASAMADQDGRHLVWDLKSVNGKSLDLRFRLPPGFDGLEPSLKLLATPILRRGSVSATLTLRQREAKSSLRVNHDLLRQIIEIIGSLEGEVHAAPPRLDGLLQIRGVLEFAEPELEDDLLLVCQATAAALFETALSRLVAARDEEGARLALILGDRLNEIATLSASARTMASAQPEGIRARFHRQLDHLIGPGSPVPAERLAQELALLIQKADVREELDRLDAHVAAARDLLAAGAGVGRKLDFLCQEFHREANTLCSKSADLDLTRLGLDLKAAIEQFREQVQNIE